MGGDALGVHIWYADMVLETIKVGYNIEIKPMRNKIAASVGSLVGVAGFLTAALAHAQYSAASSTADSLAAVNQAGAGLGANTGTILIIGIGLAVLGWVWRKIHSKVTGRSF